MADKQQQPQPPSGEWEPLVGKPAGPVPSGKPAVLFGEREVPPSGAEPAVTVTTGAEPSATPAGCACEPGTDSAH